jgi:hypothetical protein
MPETARMDAGGEESRRTLENNVSSNPAIKRRTGMTRSRGSASMEVPKILSVALQRFMISISLLDAFASREKAAMFRKPRQTTASAARDS